MINSCPHCNGRVDASANGLVCRDCGTLLDSPATPNQAPANSFDPIPVPGQPAAVPIINHHASSYYQQHLADRLAQLSTPELPSPLDELSLPDPIEPASSLRAPAVAATAISPPKAQDKLADQSLTDDRPVRPSAFVVHATQPLYPTAPVANSAESLVQSSKHDISRLVPASPIEAEAHKKADALLSMPQTSPNSVNSARSWILGLIAVLVITGSAIGAWLLLKAPTKQESASLTTPSQTPTATPSPDQDATKRDATRKSDLNSIAIGLEAYRKATGAYPVGVDISILAPLEKTTPPFITKVSLDPSSTPNALIKYSYASDGSSFTLSATLEIATDPDSKAGLYIVRSATGQ